MFLAPKIAKPDLKKYPDLLVWFWNYVIGNVQSKPRPLQYRESLKSVQVVQSIFSFFDNIDNMISEFRLDTTLVYQIKKHLIK